MALTAASWAGLGSRPADAAPGPTVPDNAGHLYTLDGWGGVHPAGSAPPLSGAPEWSGWDIARGLALFADGSGGYELDGWGGLHALGDAPAMQPGGYWKGWDIARGIALLPTSNASDPEGYVVDGWGGLHPFGGAPGMASSGYWPGWDIVTGLVILPDSTPKSIGGYVLDGDGGLHPFGTAGAVDDGAGWPNWDIARGVTLLPGATATTPVGYVVDGWGGLHPFGGAPPASAGYWPDWDVIRGVVAWTGGAATGQSGGWILDAFGGLHAFGSAPQESPGAYWPNWDIVRGMAGGADSSGVRSVVSGGGIQNVTYSAQRQALDCEAAALQMALSHEGRFVAQSALLDAMAIDGRAGYYDWSGLLHWGDPYSNFVGNPNGSEQSLTGYGTYETNVARVAAAQGATVVLAGTGITPQQLYGQVLSGHPAIAWVAYDWRSHPTSYWRAFDGRSIPWAGPVEHAVTVVGVSGGLVLVFDPARGPYWISMASFQAGYSTYRDMAVIIS